MSQYKWWETAVIYQIYPRSFNDTTANGVGDLQGIIKKLDYLNDGTENSLGVNAIWISPFYPSPMADFGYDVADYTDVEPLFGDLETFDRLIAEAHKRGIKVIIDYVPNHSSDEHPWFQESRSSRDNPRRDWYIWCDPKPDGSPPNNWGSMFGGRAWTWDATTEQYYFHQFHPKQPDLNWRNPDVRQAMHDVLRFWMARGVDGFRMDVVYIIWKHPDMPDQPLLTSLGRGADDIFGQQEQIYAFNQDGIQDIMREIHAVLAEQNAFGIAELWLSIEERMIYYADNYIPFNFDLILVDEPWSANAYRTAVDQYEALVPDGAMPNYVLGSHDVARLASRVGSEARARVAALMLLTLRGIPTLYMGDELGMVNGDIQPHQIQDPQGLNLGVAHTRDVCRTPLQWDTSDYAGFSTVEPWLPVHNAYDRRNAATLADDDRSILTLYRRLIWHRKRHLALSVGDYTPLASPDNTYVYIRQHADERYCVLLNFNATPVTVDLPTATGRLILSTGLDRVETTITSPIELRADEGLLIRL